MAQTPHDTLEQRLLCDEQILSTLRAHTTTLEAARHIALDVIASAQANLDAIDAELAQTHERTEALQRATNDLRSSLRRRLMEALPLELLREIFLELAAEPDELWTLLGKGQCNYTRSRLPFLLAATCNRWRDLALGTPALWTYIAIPPPSLQPERRAFWYPHWVQTLLQRSKTYPIDVLLPWSEASWSTDSYAAQIVSSIGNHAHRWRRFEFHIPEQYMSAETANSYRRPTPLLEWFALFGPTDGGSALEYSLPAPRYLPICPRLTAFRSEYIDLMLAVPRDPLVGLTVLEFCTTLIPCKVLWDLLRSAPCLQSLIAKFYDLGPHDLRESAGSPVPLVHLRKLVLHREAIAMFATNVSLLSLPALSSFHFSGDWLENNLHVFLQAFGGTITEFGMTDCIIDLDMLSSLHILSNVRTLHIGEDCQVQDDLLQAFAIPDEWLLPCLEELIMDGVEIERGEGDGLVHLVQSRLAPHPDANGKSPSTLRKLTIINSPKIPSWLIAELNFLMGEPVPVCDEDYEEKVLSHSDEEEAQFTDSALGADAEESDDSEDENWFPDAEEEIAAGDEDGTVSSTSSQDEDDI
ncbi:hypothetical protein EXIGLDRAFT_46784 [Exidia glandulosa HHB12029]|uniref:Uncharacterized protein n=1 Tax=Exidia glandulosa HHB12029 TaxID=1314781 RepID=A0A165P4S1_EXIGL|nr:hypothetical protein EXIGLDRAFT_46784 [Exidia glandulosa HHB12029]